MAVASGNPWPAFGQAVLDITPIVVNYVIDVTAARDDDRATFGV